jgi:hypothetical protein
MGTIVQIKRSETANAIPSVGDIAVGELAVNLADGILYSKKTDGSIIEIGSSNLPDEYYLSSNQDFGLITQNVDTTLNLGDVGTESSASKSLGDISIYVESVGVPASSTSSGTVNTIAIDTNYLYICVATDTWKRVQLSSW